jgi:Arc/MetJ-type ribon-helix-helix transcriptional regulator
MTEISEQRKQFLDLLVASGHYKDHEAAMDRAVQLLEQEHRGQYVKRPSDLSYQEWSRRFREWAESHPPAGHFVDDSRDSIYSATIDDPR